MSDYHKPRRVKRVSIEEAKARVEDCFEEDHLDNLASTIDSAASSWPDIKKAIFGSLVLMDASIVAGKGPTKAETVESLRQLRGHIAAALDLLDFKKAGEDNASGEFEVRRVLNDFFEVSATSRAPLYAQGHLAVSQAIHTLKQIETGVDAALTALKNKRSSKTKPTRGPETVAVSEFVGLFKRHNKATGRSYSAKEKRDTGVFAVFVRAAIEPVGKKLYHNNWSLSDHVIERGRDLYDEIGDGTSSMVPSDD